MREILSKLGLVRRYEPHFYWAKRQKLRERLHQVFAMDAIEGTIDCAVRSLLR